MFSRPAARRLPFAVCLSSFAFAAPAATVTLTPVADTTLIEAEPDHNLGGAPFVNAGTTQNGPHAHGLFRFDLAGALPPGSKVERAALTIEVTHQPKDGLNSVTFDLHRVLRPWGEGDKQAADPNTSPGLGAPATAGEATWNFRFVGTDQAWDEPGGAAGTDYIVEPSSSQFIYGTSDSPYVFDTDPRLVADLQLWLAHPEQNFGWMLKPFDEVSRFTARRFASREDVIPPALEVEFTPPLTWSHFTAFTLLADGRLELRLLGAPNQLYRLEALGDSPGWTTVTTAPTSDSGEVVFTTAPQESTRTLFRALAVEAAR